MATAQARPRVAFIGNCQAQSLESLCGHIDAPVEVVTLPPVFDVQQFGQARVWDRIAGCDFVFNQRVAGDYTVEFARPAFLRAQLGERAVSWPNIYFDGYFPGIGYQYSDAGKIVGPLSDYHFAFVLSAWAQGSPVQQLSQSFDSGGLAESFRLGADRSLNELRQREAGLGVRMSDVLAARWRYSKLMYTMNHPVNEVLFELLRRLLKAVGIVLPGPAERLASYPYTLDEVRIPAFPAVQRAHGIAFPAPPSAPVRGKQLQFADGTFTMPGAALDYDWPTLFETYYRLYDTVCAGSASTARILRGAGPVAL